MNNAILQWAGVAALGAGLLFAQNPGLSQRSDSQAHSWRHSQNQGQGAARGLDRLSTTLNLTADQQQQARTIFTETRQQARPLMQQIHQGRKSLFDAAKAGKSSGEIDALASAQGPLMAQMTAIQAKAFARFYATLNADQKVKLDSTAGHAGGLFMGGMGRHHQ